MIAIIDIGSNTVRMNVYDVTETSSRVLFSSKEMAGLAAQIESGFLLEKGIHNLIRILNRFKETIDLLQITEVYPFATASLRLINNQQAVLQRIKEATGFNVHLIEGEDEGYLGVLGALSDLNIPKAVLVDLGGGSCEVVPFDKKSILSSVSYPIGSLSLYKQFVSNLMPTLDEQKKIRKHVKSIINVEEIKKGDFITVVGVGGTMRALLKLKQYIDNDYSDSKQLTLKGLKQMLEQLGDGSKESMDILLKVVPDRVHTLIPGLVTIVTLLQEMDCVEIVVSNNGAREGYLLKYVLKKGD